MLHSDGQSRDVQFVVSDATYVLQDSMVAVVSYFRWGCRVLYRMKLAQRPARSDYKIREDQLPTLIRRLFCYHKLYNDGKSWEAAI